jgi:UDP-glucose 4-epimerase
MMLKGKTPTLFGHGKPVRDYVFVGDVARANVLALRKGGGEIINLGSERGSTVAQLYRHLQAILKFKAKAHLAPLRPGEIGKIYLSGAKAKRVLGWRPQTSLRDGLQKTMDWIRARERKA